MKRQTIASALVALFLGLAAFTTTLTVAPGDAHAQYAGMSCNKCVQFGSPAKKKACKKANGYPIKGKCPAATAPIAMKRCDKLGKQIPATQWTTGKCTKSIAVAMKHCEKLGKRIPVTQWTTGKCKERVIAGTSKKRTNCERTGNMILEDDWSEEICAPCLAENHQVLSSDEETCACTCGFELVELLGDGCHEACDFRDTTGNCMPDSCYDLAFLKDETGTWTCQEPACEVDCGPFLQDENGDCRFPESAEPVVQEVPVTCDTTSNCSCGDDGTPSCEGNLCHCNFTKTDTVEVTPIWGYGAGISFFLLFLLFLILWIVERSKKKKKGNKGSDGSNKPNTTLGGGGVQNKLSLSNDPPEDSA